MRKSFVIKLIEKYYPIYAEIHNNFAGTNTTFNIILNEFSNKIGVNLIYKQMADKLAGARLGYTDGKNIYLNSDIKDYIVLCFVYFHELGHFKLHYTKSGYNLPLKKRELEANWFAYAMCLNLFPDQKKLLSELRDDEGSIKVRTQKTAYNQIKLNL